MISHSWQLESGWCVPMQESPGGDGTVPPAHGTLSALELLLLTASRPYPSLLLSETKPDRPCDTKASSCWQLEARQLGFPCFISSIHCLDVPPLNPRVLRRGWEAPEATCRDDVPSRVCAAVNGWKPLAHSLHSTIKFQILGRQQSKPG